MSRRKMDGPHFPLQQTLEAAANPPGALSESFTSPPAGILGQFVVCRVSGEVGQMVGRVTPNSGDLRGGGDYGSQHAATCRTTVHSDQRLQMSIDAMHCTQVRW